MIAQAVIAALDLPAEVRVDRRVPKTTLFEHTTGLTTADKRLIIEAVEEIRWVASLKEATTSIAAYCDEQHEYLEVAVLTVNVRPGGRVARIALLLHRAVPYPTLLVLSRSDTVTVSLAEKRKSRSTKDDFVIEGDPIEAVVDGAELADARRAFLTALAISRRSWPTFRDLYSGWIEVVEALQAAEITGDFRLVTSAEDAESRRLALTRCADLSAALTQIRAQAAKATQMQAKIQLNAQIKKLRDEYDDLRARL